MSKAKDEILQSISRKGKRKELPTPWTSKTQSEDLTVQFTRALQNVKGEVYLASGMDEALQILGRVLSELNPQKIIVDNDKIVSQINQTDLNSDCEYFFVGRTEGNLRKFCANADVGVSGADVALAETGSVILKMTARRSRLTSLLPPVHIVLLPESKILPDIFTWTANLKGGEMPSQMVIISGPSKTADIEQTLVVGVHGPKRFIVIIFDDK